MSTWDFFGKNAHKVKATVLGWNMFSFFVEFPARAAVKDGASTPAHGTRLFFDLVFNERCSRFSGRDLLYISELPVSISLPFFSFQVESLLASACCRRTSRLTLWSFL